MIAEGIETAHPSVVLFGFLALIVAISPLAAVSGLTQEQAAAVVAVGYIGWLWYIAVRLTGQFFSSVYGFLGGISAAYLLLYFGILAPFVLEPSDRAHPLGSEVQDVWHAACAFGLLCILHCVARALATAGGEKFRFSSYFGFVVAVSAFPFGIWFIQRRVRSSMDPSDHNGGER